MAKTYRLTGADGHLHVSDTPGALGGNGRARIYGSLDCWNARAAMRRWPGVYETHRVFFRDEQTAIAAGFRPCGHCQRAAYRVWRAGPVEGRDYPWRERPEMKASRS